MKNSILIIAIAIYLYAPCSNQKTKQLNIAKITERGLIDCFKDTTKNGKKYYCESSAVIFYKNKITIASDKSFPQHAPLVSLNFKNNTLNKNKNTYFDNKELMSIKKIEDFTITPDKKYIFLTTGFDRLNKKSKKTIPYNNILYWPTDKPNNISVFYPSKVNNILSSVGLRSKISKALANKDFPEGPEYFKIEGIAAIPGNLLILGVREMGKRYDDFSYTIKLIAMPYKISNNKIELNGDLKVVYEFIPTTNDIKQPIGLSSIEYDSFNKRLYMLTSFENGESDEKIGAYLWTLSIENYKNKQNPTLVKKANQQALLFAHKAEGITVIDKYTVFVIHDDDRVLGRKNVTNPEIQFSRKANQAAYTIVKFIDI